MSEKRIIEINGVKLEIDMREATTIESYKVGDTVKLLKKRYSDYASHPAVIIGFDNFQIRPTIIIAYFDSSDKTIEFCYLNSESKDVEICPIDEHDIDFKKSDVLERMDNEIHKKEDEVKELKKKKEYFLKHFSKYFKDTEGDKK